MAADRVKGCRRRGGDGIGIGRGSDTVKRVLFVGLEAKVCAAAVRSVP